MVGLATSKETLNVFTPQAQLMGSIVKFEAVKYLSDPGEDIPVSNCTTFKSLPQQLYGDQIRLKQVLINLID